MSEPIVYDLCCGLGGWTEGFQAEGYRAIGYDIESHEYGDHRYPGELRIKSIIDLNGADLADAACIVASPPCQRYSYMAMPWSRAKEIAVKYREDTGDLNDLFNACFRIQREASIAARRHIPLVVENVKGAQPWVGRAAWHYGSFYLWGDVPALMPQTYGICGFLDLKCRDLGSKSTGQDWSRFAKIGEVSPHWNLAAAGVKHPRYPSGGVKQAGLSGPAWFDGGMAHLSSNSTARKAASAFIAKIPFELSSYLARHYKPR